MEPIQDLFNQDKLMAMAFFIITMVERMKDSGNTINYMDTVSLSGQTEEYIKVTTPKDSNRNSEPCNIATVEYIKENG